MVNLQVGKSYITKASGIVEIIEYSKIKKRYISESKSSGKLEKYKQNGEFDGSYGCSPLWSIEKEI